MWVWEIKLWRGNKHPYLLSHLPDLKRTFLAHQIHQGFQKLFVVQRQLDDLLGFGLSGFKSTEASRRIQTELEGMRARGRGWIEREKGGER